MNKTLKVITNLYRRKIPTFLRQSLYNLELRVSYWYNPLLKNRVTIYAVNNLYEACKKELKKNNLIITHNFHEIFRKNLVRSYLVDNKWWSDFIILTSLPGGSEFEKTNQSLINRIDTSNFNSLEYYEILHIYSLSVRFGLFELGFHLREKSLKVALTYSVFFKKSEIWKLKAKLSALLETGNFSEFDHLFPLFKGKWKNEILFLKNLRELLGENENLSNIELVSNFNSKNDLKFRKFLENKKIAIVSPSPVDKKDGYEIDNSSDIVIRTRYMAKYSLHEQMMKGSKCDVTYMYADHSRYISEKGCLQWPLDISWIVGKAPSQSEIILKRLFLDGVNIKNLRGRTIETIDKALFNGALHGLPNIVMDILHSNPKKIFLYHFDMMLTKERVAGYTPENLKENKDVKYLVNKRLNGLAGHDPVTQFVIMKSFWKRGIVDGDYRFEEVMKMKVEDYMKNLQKYYRKLINVEID